MPLLSRLSPTLRAYIREEYRRVWTRREYRTLLITLFVVEVLRVAATWLVTRGEVRPGGVATELLSFAGMVSTVTYMGSLARVLTPVSQQWVFWTVFEVLSLFGVLLPYYAGRSMAAVRKYRELDDLKARGLSERQILVGRGIAHLAPFLCTWALTIVVGVLQLVTFLAPGPRGWWMSRIGGGGVGPVYVVQMVIVCLVYPLGSLARMGILVCASALSRRVWGGVALAYGLALLLFPGILMAARAVTAVLTGPVVGSGSTLIVSTVPTVVAVVLECVLLLPFYVAAIRALAGQTPIRLPAMDQPRSLWVDEEQPAAPAPKV